jgi:hypothetical protein
MSVRMRSRFRDRCLRREPVFRLRKLRISPRGWLFFRTPPYWRSRLTTQHRKFSGKSSHKSELDLIFAEPDGTPLTPNSISSSVSLLFKRLKIPKPKGAALHLFRHSQRVAPVGGGYGIASGFRAAGSQFGDGDCDSLFASPHGARSRSGNPVGRISAVTQPTGPKAMSECVTLCDRNFRKELETW